MKGLCDQRANWIDPHLERRWLALRAEGRRLTRRIRWLENWPKRHRRQLAQYGYTLGGAPPTYLVAREDERIGSRYSKV